MNNSENSVNIILSGTISAESIVEIAFANIRPEGSKMYNDLFNEAQTLLNKLIIIPTDEICNSNIIFECIISELMYIVTNQDNVIRNTNPYHSGLSQSTVVDNFSNNMRSIIDDVAEGINEDSLTTVRTIEGEGAEYSVNCDMNGINLEPHHIANFNPKTVDTIADNNSTIKSLREYIYVIEMFFDYLWSSRILEDTYYYLRDKTRSGKFRFNVISNSINFYPVGNGEYHFALHGTITFDMTLG